jgi:hypothetical protein
MHILLTLFYKWNLVIPDELVELYQYYKPKVYVVSKNLTNPFFDGCFYKPKLMDVYVLKGTTLAKFGSYYRWQLFSHGQLVSNSTHSFFAYSTCKGHYFQ